jgi:kynurenine formamidase
MALTQHRVRFDFEIAFSNGGQLQGHGFRLDIEGDDIADDALSDALVRDLRLLMVGTVRVFHKEIITEPHKRNRPAAGRYRLVDLSHEIENGMVTYRGLPAPIVCDYVSREASRRRFRLAPGVEFHIGRIDMVANTGTYVDSPFHRFADGADLGALPLERLANLASIVVPAPYAEGRAITRARLGDFDASGKAILVRTGWDAHWRTDRYFAGHPFLTADAAQWLADCGAALVGIDSLNIDDAKDGDRPVHSRLLGAGIPIVEHLRGLSQLPPAGFRFTAVPAKVRAFGSFPVRAYAELGNGANAP